MQNYLAFRLDLEDADVGFLDGWKAVIEPDDQGRVFARLETNLNALAEARGELTLTIPMAYVEARKN